MAEKKAEGSRNFRVGVLSGFVGTLAMTITIMIFNGLGLMGNFNLLVALGLLLNVPPAVAMPVGLLEHFLIGIGYGIILVFVFKRPTYAKAVFFAAPQTIVFVLAAAMLLMPAAGIRFPADSTSLLTGLVILAFVFHVIYATMATYTALRLA